MNDSGKYDFRKKNKQFYKTVIGGGVIAFVVLAILWYGLIVLAKMFI